MLGQEAWDIDKGRYCLTNIVHKLIFPIKDFFGKRANPRCYLYLLSAKEMLIENVYFRCDSENLSSSA